MNKEMSNYSLYHGIHFFFWSINKAPDSSDKESSFIKINKKEYFLKLYNGVMLY
jgi:hypothetical protein